MTSSATIELLWEQLDARIDALPDVALHELSADLRTFLTNTRTIAFYLFASTVNELNLKQKRFGIRPDKFNVQPVRYLRTKKVYVIDCDALNVDEIHRINLEADGTFECHGGSSCQCLLERVMEGFVAELVKQRRGTKVQLEKKVMRYYMQQAKGQDISSAPSSKSVTPKAATPAAAAAAASFHSPSAVAARKRGRQGEEVESAKVTRLDATASPAASASRLSKAAAAAGNAGASSSPLPPSVASPPGSGSKAETCLRAADVQASISNSLIKGHQLASTIRSVPNPDQPDGQQPTVIESETPECQAKHDLRRSNATVSIVFSQQEYSSRIFLPADRAAPAFIFTTPQRELAQINLRCLVALFLQVFKPDLPGTTRSTSQSATSQSVTVDSHFGFFCFFDPDSRVIAFNRNKTLWFNLAQQRAPMADIIPRFEKWFLTVCHELTHNFEANHGTNFIRCFSEIVLQFAKRFREIYSM